MACYVLIQQKSLLEILPRTLLFYLLLPTYDKLITKKIGSTNMENY